jgi:hypothetical protein
MFQARLLTAKQLKQKGKKKIFFRLQYEIFSVYTSITIPMYAVDTRVQLPARRAYSPEGGPGTGFSLKGSVCFITYKYFQGRAHYL